MKLNNGNENKERHRSWNPKSIKHCWNRFERHIFHTKTCSRLFSDQSALRPKLLKYSLDLSPSSARRVYVLWNVIKTPGLDLPDSGGKATGETCPVNITYSGRTWIENVIFYCNPFIAIAVHALIAGVRYFPTMETEWSCRADKRLSMKTTTQ